MKTRTRLFSYTLAFLMLISCIMSMGWLSLPVFADQLEEDDNTNWNIPWDGSGWAEDLDQKAVYRIYFVLSSSFGDGEYVSYGTAQNTFKNLISNPNAVAAYRSDSVFISPVESGTHKLYSGASITVRSSSSIGGAWDSIMAGAGDYRNPGVPGANLRALQQSNTVEWEYENVVKPLARYTGLSAMVDEYYKQGIPITIVIEPMAHMTYSYESRYVSVMDINKVFGRGMFEAGGFPPGRLENGTFGYGVWNILPQLSQIRPGWRESRESNNIQDFGYSNISSGWAYYTLCNGEHDGTVTFDITKIANVQAKGGANAAEFAEGVEAMFTVYGVTEAAAIDSFANTAPSPVIIEKGESAAGVFSAIYQAYGRKISNAEVIFKNAVGYMQGKGINSGAQFTQSKKLEINVSMSDATAVWYFLVVENDVSSSCTKYEITSTPEPGGILFRYVPIIKDGEVVDAQWDYAEFKSQFLPDKEELCWFDCTGTSLDKIVVTATNPFEITDTPSAEFVAPLVTVLDVDDYYVTSYKGDYNIANNRQLVYTRSTLVNPDKQPFFPAFSIDGSPALNNSKGTIEQLSKDNDVDSLDIPKDNASYTEQAVTSKYDTVELELQQDALRSFTVSKNFILDYGNVIDNPSSINTAYTTTLKSADTDQGSLAIPFNGGESYNVGNNTKDWEDYVKYAEMYAKYEAAIASSAGLVRSALTYWSSQALQLYAKAQAVYSGIPTAKASRTKEALDKAWADIEKLAKTDTVNLYAITGWEFKLKTYYYTKCTHCGGTGYHSVRWEGQTEWTKYACQYCSGGYIKHDDYTKNGGSDEGVKIKGATSGISSTVAAGVIQYIFSEANYISTGSLLGKLSDVNTEQLKEIARLEKGRPHAEIHQYLEFATKYDDTIYKVADVPQWYIAFRWENQKAFLVNGSLLSTLLDFEAYGSKLTSPAIGTNKEVDKTPLVLLQTVPESFNKDLRGYFVFRNNETSMATTTQYSPLFAWYYKDVSLLNSAKQVVQAIGVNSFTTTAETKDGKFSLNSSKTDTRQANLIYVANLDAFGYAQTAIASHTSVWQIISGNPTHDVLPGGDWTSTAYLPADIVAAVNSATGLKNAQRGNTSSTGNNAKGKDTYVIGDPNTQSGTSVSIALTYSKNALTKKSASLIDYYINTYNVNQGGKSTNKTGTVNNALTNWYSDKVVYTLEAEFKHYNVGGQPGIPVLEPESDIIENNSNDPSEETTDKIGADGHYTRNRDKEVFSIYPLVRRAFYAPLGKDPQITYTVGQAPRELRSHVYYYMGINGTANPTVVANSLGSGSVATGLSNAYGGAPVALSGTGITVSYDPDVSLVFQSFNLCNIDAEEGYQSAWGNVVYEPETAHLEWLHSMGATTYYATVAGEEVSTLGIPYIAGVDCYIKDKKSAWQLTQDGAQIALKNDNAQGTQEFTITMRVEKGELTEVHLPDSIVAPADGSDPIPAGTYKGSSTYATLGGMPKYLADAIRGTGITGGSDCVLKQTFVNNVGDAMKADANSKVASGVVPNGNPWYNEYCYCIGLKFCSTVFNMQPLIFTDKIPIELGPNTPVNKSDYYQEGYPFIAQTLMLKVGTSPDPTQTDITPEETGVQDILDEVWRITRDDKKIDLVISNVPVTGANN